MEEKINPAVVAVSNTIDVETIDNGRTLAVRFIGADDRELVILLPRFAAETLCLRITDSLETAILSQSS